MIQLVRIIETEYGDPGIIRVRAVYEDLSDYVSSAKGAPALSVSGETLSLSGTSRLALLDIATLKDKDDGPGYYLAAGGATGRWRGAKVFISLDGEDFKPLVSVTVEAAMGVALTALPTGPTLLWDEVNTVDVQLFGDDSLFSETEDNVLKGENLISLGQELVLFQNAAQLSAQKWRLSRFVRGVKGTEWATATHKSGEAFVWLNRRAIERIEDELADIGIQRQYRAPSIGDSIEDAVTKLFTNTGVSLKPWSPVDITGVFDGSNNIIITARRRSRLSGRNGRDFFDPPLGESSEAYQLDILSDDELAVKRTLAPTSLGATGPTFTYLIANQTTDFGGAKNHNLHLNIYQISAQVGRGYPGHAVLNPIGFDDGESLSLLAEELSPFLAEDGDYLLYGA